MKRDNEENAIGAILEMMPFVTGGYYKKESSPDEPGAQEKEVDYILKPDSNVLPFLAVEHTRVEAFSGQKLYVNRSYKIIQEVDNRCKGHLPADKYFKLVVPPILVESLRRGAISRFVEFITPWVTTTAKTLLIDEHKTIMYAKHDVLLLCGGSHPDINGTVGRFPGSPNNQNDLAIQRLWYSFEHGLAKFSKYKTLGYDTILSLEDISGAISPLTLAGIEVDPQQKALVDSLVDYIVLFDSNEDRMIVGLVYKEKSVRNRPIPYNRKFH